MQPTLDIAALDAENTGHAFRFARQLESLTGLESRVTILGYVQRGGTPSAADRLLAARLGNAAADLVAAGTFGVMVAATGEGVRAVPLDLVAGRRKTVPTDHDWIETARHVGTCLGDSIRFVFRSTGPQNGSMSDPTSPGSVDAGRVPTVSLTRGFLFADLRGYTQFGESHGAVRASQLIERYRVLVRTAVTRFRGAEIKTEGDSFYVVFDAVSAAVGCGLAISEAAAKIVDGPSRRPDPRRDRDPRRGDGRNIGWLRRIGGQCRRPHLRDRRPGRGPRE